MCWSKIYRLNSVRVLVYIDLVFVDRKKCRLQTVSLWLFSKWLCCAVNSSESKSSEDNRLWTCKASWLQWRWLQSCWWQGLRWLLCRVESFSRVNFQVFCLMCMHGPLPVCHLICSTASCSSFVAGNFILMTRLSWDVCRRICSAKKSEIAL